jgi:gamma-glutamyltranspeptidase/glutathione hydrolase
VTTLGATGRNWAISTPHVTATEAGAAAFERGGNAVDAALAAAIALAVVYPHMCGVGGDLFALVLRPDGQTLAVNSSGRSPRTANAAAVHETHRRIPDRGPIPITVPGAPAGWRAVHELGADRPWAEAFSAALPLAFDGAPISRSLAEELAYDHEVVAADPGLSTVFAPTVTPIERGVVVRQTQLGASLEALASVGPEALYRGEVGRRYVEGLRHAGSPLDMGDLAAHRAFVLSPLRAGFRDLHASVVPPNSQGFVLLQILALIERLQLDPDPFGRDAGPLAHVFRAASMDRERHLADPDAMVVHPSTLLDDGHLAGLADEVRALMPSRGQGVHAPEGGRATVLDDGASGSARGRSGGDTVALVAVDGAGFAVSLIQSLYHGFGAGILEPATGIVAHNRGACFTLDPGHPNDFESSKRPAHTLMPILVHDAHGLAAVAGTMGGHAQPQINAHTLLRTFALGHAPPDAVAAPRWLVAGMDADTSAARVVAEEDVPREAVDSLESAGFGVDRVGTQDEGVGHAHMIRTGPNGFVAGSDPRADGGALAG